MRDAQGRWLIDHGGIYLLELGKFARAQVQSDDVASELERRLRFFTEAERLDAQALPHWMQTDEMAQAVRGAVQAGEYASSSEIIREALCRGTARAGSEGLADIAAGRVRDSERIIRKARRSGGWPAENG